MVRGASYLLCFACVWNMPAVTAAGPPADTPAQAAGDQGERDIVVTGPNLDALDKYVEQLTATPNDSQLARWNDHICPRAVGVAPQQNAFLASRIAAVAREARIPVERGSCRANILVVVTQEADAFGQLLFKRHPKLFGAYGSGRPPADAVAALLAPRPVRWLNASTWGNGQGAPVVDGNKNFIYSASRLQESTRQNATLSLVIVDATMLQGVTWGGLSNYIAMVALARPAPGVEPKTGSTILALFRNRDEKRAGPDSLTRWDRAFLKNLYASKANASWSAQTSQIRTGMKRDISSGATEQSND